MRACVQSTGIQTPCGKQAKWARGCLLAGKCDAIVGARGMHRRGSVAVASINYKHADPKVTTNPHHDIELQSLVYVRVIYYTTMSFVYMNIDQYSRRMAASKYKIYPNLDEPCAIEKARYGL